ncbi:host cell division inhibitor Icd-like protein [Vibrio parahaemolyticus]|nr:host cell division inhibitor Icd-like protein [Vibrio parahaemolyticus]
MIYTFLIAGGARTCALSDLKRIRNISTVANTEQQAREQLNGLKLVFISRVREGASC